MGSVVAAVAVCAVVFGCGGGVAFAADESGAAPEGLAGFRGLLAGTLVSKAEAGLVVKVDKVLRVWEKNEAKNPENAVGKELTLHINTKVRWAKRLHEKLGVLKVGDRIEAGAFANDGRLWVGEVLQKALSLPVDVRGFLGMLSGTVKSKGEDRFVLKVEKVVKTWKKNRASKAEAAVGLELTLVLAKRGDKPNPHLETLKGLKVGDRVTAGARHREGDVLILVEALRKAD